MENSIQGQEASRLKQKSRIARRTSLFIIYAIMLLFAAWAIFPIVFTLVSSGKPDTVLFEDIRSLNAFLPTQFSLDNYYGVFDRVEFGLFLRNSVIVSAVTVFFSIFINSMAAFSLARLRWPGRKLIIVIVIALIVVPFESIAVPLLYVVNKLFWPTISLTNGFSIELTQSWLNTLHVQIVPFIADSFSIFLFYQAFLDIPKELDESALVDGATPFRIYWQIILPLARPTVATVAILQFLFRWNDYLWPVMAVPGEQARPLTVGIASFYTQTPQWGQILAYASMITIPVLIVFLLFQKWFIRSVATSGIKG